MKVKTKDSNKNIFFIKKEYIPLQKVGSVDRAAVALLLPSPSSLLLRYHTNHKQLWRHPDHRLAILEI